MSQHILRQEGAKPTTVKCPECGDIVVYNGNYFCNSFDALRYDRKLKEVVVEKGTCTWALPHPATRALDRKVIVELIEGGYLTETERP